MAPAVYMHAFWPDKFTVTAPATGYTYMIPYSIPPCPYVYAYTHVPDGLNYNFSGIKNKLFFSQNRTGHTLTACPVVFHGLRENEKAKNTASAQGLHSPTTSGYFKNFCSRSRARPDEASSIIFSAAGGCGISRKESRDALPIPARNTRFTA